jgi:hypothetical protein
MSDLYKKLIGLYAVNSISDVQNNTNNIFLAQFKEAETLINNNKSFNDLKKEIENLKDLIEKNLLTIPMLTTSQQVHESLQFVLNLSIFDFRDLEQLQFQGKMNIVKDLIVKYFEGMWNANTVSYFETQVDKIIKSNYLFISYTNKDAKIINLKYKTLILEVADRYGLDKPLTQDDWDKRNLLALVLSRVLTKLCGLPATRIFYDRDDLEPGDRINDILPICYSSLQFLQLVSNRVFFYEQPNWTYMEYQKFNSKPPVKKAIFTIAGDALPQMPPFAYPGYKSWFDSATDQSLYRFIPKEWPEFEIMATDLAKTMKKFLYHDILVPTPEVL